MNGSVQYLDGLSSFLVIMKIHSLHVEKLFTFALFRDHTWEIIVAQFQVVTMAMETVFLPLAVNNSHKN